MGRGWKCNPKITFSDESEKKCVFWSYNKNASENLPFRGVCVLNYWAHVLATFLPQFLSQLFYGHDSLITAPWRSSKTISFTFLIFSGLCAPPLTFIGVTHRLLHLAPFVYLAFFWVCETNSLYCSLSPISRTAYITVHHIVPDICFYALALVYLPSLCITLYFRTRF